MVDAFIPLVAEAEFPTDGKLSTQVNGWHVLVCKLEDGFHAVNDRCTHAASMLSTGRIRRGTIMCPLHGARFDLATGTCIGGTYRSLRIFPLQIVDGKICVAVPDQKPGMDDLPISTGSLA
jgi:anthranilate 1,2-dioxygenase ferredoxin component